MNWYALGSLFVAPWVLWGAYAVTRFHPDFGECGSDVATWRLCAATEKNLRIGMLETVATALKTVDYDAFLAGLDALGYIEGRDFKIEYRSVDGHPDRFQKLAQDLVSQNVDLITTRGTPAALAAKNATKTIPVVMAANGEPLLVVASIARPGGNITGLSAFVNDLMGKPSFFATCFPGFHGLERSSK